MRKKTFLVMAIATAAVSLFFVASDLIGAEGSGTIALTGQVSAKGEGPLEGVLVSAKKDGSTITITVTVVSDQQGRYSFPSAKVGPGRYAIKIRAVGYDLDGPKAVDVGPGKTATADLTLRKARNIVSQLTNAEWLASIPGTENQKKQLLGCTNCHTLERTVSSTHDAEGFAQVMARRSSSWSRWTRGEEISRSRRGLAKSPNLIDRGLESRPRIGESRGDRMTARPAPPHPR